MPIFSTKKKFPNKKVNVFDFLLETKHRDGTKKKKATNEKQIHNKHQNRSFNEDKNNKLRRPFSSNAYG